MRKIHVAVEKPYEVTVGRDLTADIAKSISTNVYQIAIIYAAAMKKQASELAKEISRHNSQTKCHLIAAPDSEAAKAYEFAQVAWNILGELKFTRSDLIISLGGGATTDVAGFVAATWLRGIGIIHIPTTLLAMVDAAVGGKTGINTQAGKNLVGAFHHPNSVWCDLDFLTTLPTNDLRAGFAEIVKCGFISDLKILDQVEKHQEKILDPSSPALVEVIGSAISVKAKVVAADFKEDQVGGLGREILNYGHTLGHAIENLEEYKWRHGEAISVGMMFAGFLSLRVGLCEDSLVTRQQAIFDILGLPTKYDGEIVQLLQVMAIDKKARGNKLRFIGLAKFGKPQVITSPAEEDLRWAFDQIRGES